MGLFSVCLLCQPISSGADLSDTYNSIKDGAESFINDPAGSLNSITDKAEGFFKTQLGLEVDFDQWYSTLSVESQNAYQKVQGLIESGKAKTSDLKDYLASLNDGEVPEFEGYLGRITSAVSGTASTVASLSLIVITSLLT